MSDNDFTQPLSAVGKLKDIAWCQFTTAGTGAVTGTTGEGYVSVARTGVGVFRVTLPYVTWAMVPFVSQGGAAAAQLGHATIRTISTSSKYIDIAVVDFGGTPADVETTGVTIYLHVYQQKK